MSSTNKKVAEFEDYPTPRPLVEALFKHIDWDALRHFASYDNRPARFLEPCRGLKRNIYDLVPSDFERYYCEIQEGLDYLEAEFSPIHFDIIVTNPPFSLFEEFVTKARSEVADHGFVCFLMRLNALGAKKREQFWANNPPDKILVAVPRPDFSGGGGDSCEYAWFCWDPTGILLTDSNVGRLNWDKPSKRRSKKKDNRKLTDEKEIQTQ